MPLRRVASAAFVLSLGASLPAGAAPQHPDDGKGADAQAPYEGTGYRGAAVVPDDGQRVLDMYANNINLLSWMPLGEIPGNHDNANDIWGYVSPGGREYAILGLENGTAFVEVTDPANPQLIEMISDTPSLWSDMVTWDQYCYNVNEYGDGIQVIDLGEIDAGTVSFVREIHDEGIDTAHNVRMSEASATLFAVGADIYGGGLVAFDLTDPARPTFAGGWDEAYVHDVVIHTYDSGPYAGREIAFASCGEQGLKVVDVTDKSDMTTIGDLAYPTVAYCHHSWLDDDQRYLYINDEGDEIWGTVTTTTTYVVDVQDIAAPFLAGSFTNGLPAIDHNPMGRGHLLFEANYRSGLRVYDISDPLAAEEVAYFDTYPADDEASFNGAWGVYTRLPSGVVLVSDMQRGLFVLEVSGTVSVDDPAPAARLDLSPAYPNPFAGHTRISFLTEQSQWVRLQVVDASGRIVETLADGVVAPGHHVRVWHAESLHGHGPAGPTSGVYFAVLETEAGRSARKMVLLK